MDANLHLVSWNLHGAPISRPIKERMKLASREIGKRTPDLVLLQEIWTDGQAGVIEGKLGGEYDLIHVPKGGIPGRKGGLLSLLRRDSQWKLLSERFIEFEAEASDWAFWQGDGLGDKGIQSLHLQHDQPNLKAIVLNVHLQSPYSRLCLFEYAGIRARQLQGLHRAVATADGVAPILAAGDLNTGQHEEIYRRELEPFWTDLTAEKRARCQCATHFGVSQGPGQWIDYILARPSAALLVRASVQLIKNDGCNDPWSDHHGLDATLVFAPAGRSSVGLTHLAGAQLAGSATRRAWLAAAGDLLLRAAVPGLEGAMAISTLPGRAPR